MRLGELVRSTVIDADGRTLGRVHDVRLVQDGPLLEGFGAALRVEGLVVGRGSVATRLGYHRHRVRGPLVLKALFGALERRARFVPWAEVTAWDGTRVVLGCRASALPRLADMS